MPLVSLIDFLLYSFYWIILRLKKFVHVVLTCVLATLKVQICSFEVSDVTIKFSFYAMLIFFAFLLYFLISRMDLLAFRIRTDDDCKMLVTSSLIFEWLPKGCQVLNERHCNFRMLHFASFAFQPDIWQDCLLVAVENSFFLMLLVFSSDF